jgi:hypothetical protein
MPEISAHAWFSERLAALLAEAERAGYARDVAEAVITDLMNGAFAAPVPPPDENWSRDPGEAAGAASEMPRHQSAATEEAVEGTPFGGIPMPPYSAV